MKLSLATLLQVCHVGMPVGAFAALTPTQHHTNTLRKTVDDGPNI